MIGAVGSNGTLFPRRVEVEELDHLTVDDPRAIRSRADLYRINRVMQTGAILLRALDAYPRQAPHSIVELGCGDARIMLGLATSLYKRWPAVQLTLVDRQALVTAQTLQAFASLGWHVRVLVDDVMDWANRVDEPHVDLVVCNLFIHHFSDDALVDLFNALSGRTKVFLACEPRRARLALLGSHLVGCLGANSVTRADAVLSVHAGFRGHELSLAWPKSTTLPWRLEEYSAGWFSHCFMANQEL